MANLIELLADKAAFEAQINAPDTTEAAKVEFRGYIAAIDDEIKAIEAKQKPPEPPKKKDTVVAKKPTESETWAHLKKKFPELTLAELKDSEIEEYKAAFRDVQREIESFRGEANGRKLADKFIAKFLPKGKSEKVSTKAKEVAKPTIKKKESPKPVAKKGDPSGEIRFMTKLDANVIDGAKDACLHNLKMVTAKQDFVIVKQKDTIKKGETIVFNEEGYFVTAFTEISAAKRCKPLVATVTKAHHDKKIGEMQAEIDKLQSKVDSKKVKGDAPKKTKLPKPKAAQTVKKKKRAKCTAKELDAASTVAKVMKFAEKYTKGWHGNERKIELISIFGMRESGQVVVKTVKWGGLSRLAGTQWYKLCLDRMELTDKIDAPKRGSYKSIEGVSVEKLKELYVKKEPRRENYIKYLEMRRSLLACSKDKSCDVGNKWSKFYKEEGNVIKTIKRVPEFMKSLHDATADNRKSGEKYYDAFKRTKLEETKRLQES